MPETAIILAGGKSLRYSAATTEHKALGRLGGRSLLCHGLDYLADSGVCRAIVCSNSLAPLFIAHLRQLPAAAAPALDVTVIDTGDDVSTAGRLLQAARRCPNETVLVAYCDVLSDLDLGAFSAFHEASGCAASVVAVNPPEPYGVIDFDGDRVGAFEEKTPDSARWVNGGYFLVSPQALAAIDDPRLSWEQGAVPELARRGQLAGYRHRGFWAAMETQKDRLLLEALCTAGGAPWHRVTGQAKAAGLR